jgi:hypothetical protein
MTPEVAAASQALNDEMAANALTWLGDIAFNEETGEIVEWPAGAGDQLEGLTMRLAQAKANEEGWKQAQGRLKTMIGRLLTDRGVKSLSTQYGTVSWRAKTDTRLAMTRLATTADDAEWSRELLIRTLGELGSVAVSKDTEAALRAALGQIVADSLLVRSESEPWVQIDKPRLAPPVIEKVSRDGN